MSEDGERSTPGAGLINGLAVTLRTMTKRSTTQQYPDVEPELPPRSRGVIALLEENCTVCMLCARECPDWCIYIDSHKEEVVVPGAARARQRNVLDKFDIDFSLCMYCGICIEVCPFDALHWSPEFEYSEMNLVDLLHDKGRLAEWMPTVPPPPAHDVLGEPSKEETTAAKKAAGPGAATAAKSVPPRVRREPRAATPAAAPPPEAAPTPGAASTDRPAPSAGPTEKPALDAAPKPAPSAAPTDKPAPSAAPTEKPAAAEKRAPDAGPTEKPVPAPETRPAAEPKTDPSPPEPGT